MKKKIMLIWLALFCIVCYGQKTDSINQVQDYVTAKLVAQYLDKLEKKEDRNNYDKIRNKLKENSITKAIGNQELSELLDKNGFKNTNVTFVSKVAKLKLEDKRTIVTQIFSIPSIVTKDTSLKTELQDEVIKFFTPSIDKKTTDKNPQAVDKDSAPNNSDEDKNKDPGGFFAFTPNLWNILIVFVIVLICISINNSIRNSKLSRRSSASDDSSNQTEIDTRYVDREVMLLNRRINTLTTLVESIKTSKPEITYERPDDKQDTNDTKNAGNNIGNSNPPNRNPESNVFFMLEPIDDAFSNITKSHEYRKGFSMYKFFQKDNSGEASFEFISDDENIKIVRNNYLKSIRPACTMVNDANLNTSTVKTLEKGTARLEGDNWKIVKKATIKFE